MGGSLIGESPGPPGLCVGAFCGSLGSGVRGGGECGCGVGGSSLGGTGGSGFGGGSAGDGAGGSMGVDAFIDDDSVVVGWLI